MLLDRRRSSTVLIGSVALFRDIQTSVGNQSGLQTVNGLMLFCSRAGGELRVQLHDAEHMSNIDAIHMRGLLSVLLT